MGVAVAICARRFLHDFSTPSFLPFLIFHHDDGREMFRNVNVEHGGQKKEKKNRGASIVSPLLRHMLQEVSWAQGCNLL